MEIYNATIIAPLCETPATELKTRVTLVAQKSVAAIQEITKCFFRVMFVPCEAQVQVENVRNQFRQNQLM